MTLKLVTPPDGEIITVDQAKRYLRKDSDFDDDLVGEMIQAARHFIEGPAGRLNAVFLTQTWMLQLDSFPTGEIMIPLAPVQSITSINYSDEDGNLQPVDPLDFYLDADNRPPWVLTTGDFDWPSPVLDAANVVEVTFVGGYPPGTASESGANEIAMNVPATVKLAVKMLVQHWFDNRGLMGQGTFEELPYNIKRLLQPYRMFI